MYVCISTLHTTLPRFGICNWFRIAAIPRETPLRYLIALFLRDTSHNGILVRDSSSSNSIISLTAHIHTYIYIYILTHIHTYTHTYGTYIHIYTYMHWGILTYKHIIIQTCIHTYIYIDIQKYIHTYIYTFRYEGHEEHCGQDNGQKCLVRATLGHLRKNRIQYFPPTNQPLFALLNALLTVLYNIFCMYIRIYVFMYVCM